MDQNEESKENQAQPELEQPKQGLNKHFLLKRFYHQSSNGLKN